MEIFKLIFTVIFLICCKNNIFINGFSHNFQFYLNHLKEHNEFINNWDYSIIKNENYGQIGFTHTANQYGESLFIIINCVFFFFFKLFMKTVGTRKGIVHLSNSTICEIINFLSFVP